MSHQNGRLIKHIIQVWRQILTSASMNSLLISLLYPLLVSPSSCTPSTSRNSAPTDLACSATEARVSNSLGNKERGGKRIKMGMRVPTSGKERYRH